MGTTGRSFVGIKESEAKAGTHWVNFVSGSTSIGRGVGAEDTGGAPEPSRFDSGVRTLQSSFAE